MRRRRQQGNIVGLQQNRSVGVRSISIGERMPREQENVLLGNVEGSRSPLARSSTAVAKNAISGAAVMTE